MGNRATNRAAWRAIWRLCHAWDRVADAAERATADGPLEPVVGVALSVVQRGADRLLPLAWSRMQPPPPERVGIGGEA